MPSFAQAAGAAELLHETAIIITPVRCARYRHKASQCAYCEAVCPADAIGFDVLNAPVIDGDTCLGCGACASVCPTGALEHDGGGTESDIAMSIAACGDVTFACTRAGDVVGALSVPCLARIDAGLILHALASGASCVHLVSELCESCPSKDAGLLARAFAETADGLASSCGMQDAVMTSVRDVAEEEAAHGPALSRRAFFLMLSSKGAGVGVKAAHSALARSSGVSAADPRRVRAEFTKHVPTSRIRLADALLGLAAEDAASLGGFLFSLPAADGERCRGCAMCATVCPTGALEVVREEERFTLTFDAKVCTSCYLCEDVCGKGAITRSEGALRAVLWADEPLVLVDKRCEDPYAVKPEDKLGRLFSTHISRA